MQQWAHIGLTGQKSYALACEAANCQLFEDRTPIPISDQPQFNIRMLPSQETESSYECLMIFVRDEPGDAENDLPPLRQAG